METWKRTCVWITYIRRCHRVCCHMQRLGNWEMCNRNQVSHRHCTCSSNPQFHRHCNHNQTCLINCESYVTTIARTPLRWYSSYCHTQQQGIFPLYSTECFINGRLTWGSDSQQPHLSKLQPELLYRENIQSVILYENTVTVNHLSNSTVVSLKLTCASKWTLLKQYS